MGVIEDVGLGMIYGGYLGTPTRTSPRVIEDVGVGMGIGVVAPQTAFDSQQPSFDVPLQRKLLQQRWELHQQQLQLDEQRRLAVLQAPIPGQAQLEEKPEINAR